MAEGTFVHLSKRFFTFGRQEADKLAAATFWATVALVGLVLWGIGATFQRAWESDVPILLDGAWRVFQGQRPWVDFQTPLGPVTFLIIAGGMKLTGFSTAAIGHSSALLFVVVSIWAYALSRARMGPWLSLISGLGAGLTAGGTSCYGFGAMNITHVGYAALYNRHGEALTILVLIECLWPLRNSNRRWQALFGGLSSGIVLSLLFFLKINFFAAALFLIGAMAFVLKYPRNRWLGIITGGLLMSVLMLAYLRFDFAAIAQDLTLTVQARGGKLFHDVPRILSGVPFTLTQIYLLFLLWWMTPASNVFGRPWLPPKIRQAFLVGFILVAQLVIFWTCTQTFTPTLFAWAALLVLHARSEISGTTHPGGPPSRTITGSWKPISMLAAVPIGIVLFTNLASIGFSAGYRLFQIPNYQGQRFDSTSLADLIANKPYVEKINDGLKLLRAHSRTNETILTLDYNNPFSFGLLRPSARGDLLWWDQDMTYKKTVRPPADRLFYDTVLVMVPKDPEVSAVGLPILYQADLESRFTRAAESSHWILYRKNVL